MAPEFGNRFTPPQRWVLGLFGAVATVVVLVLVYRATAPRSVQTTAASGERISASDVLQVGALPVT